MLALHSQRLTRAQEKTLNSCFQTQFLSLHILTCRPDISGVQETNTRQLPHKALSLFFSCTCYVHIPEQNRKHAVITWEDRHERTERKKRESFKKPTLNLGQWGTTNATALISLTCIKQRPEHLAQFLKYWWLDTFSKRPICLQRVLSLCSLDQ